MDLIRIPFKVYIIPPFPRPPKKINKNCLTCSFVRMNIHGCVIHDEYGSVIHDEYGSVIHDESHIHDEYVTTFMMNNTSMFLINMPHVVLSVVPGC